MFRPVDGEACLRAVHGNLSLPARPLLLCPPSHRRARRERRGGWFIFFLEIGLHFWPPQKIGCPQNADWKSASNGLRPMVGLRRPLLYRATECRRRPTPGVKRLKRPIS